MLRCSSSGHLAHGHCQFSNACKIRRAGNLTTPGGALTVAEPLALLVLARQWGPHSTQNRLGEWQQWRLLQLTRPEEALAIRSFTDILTDQCESKPRIVAMHVPDGYDDDSDYWLMLVTSVEAVGNHQGVEDSVKQKVKKGDADRSLPRKAAVVQGQCSFVLRPC
jgi:hypothetical protein